MRRDVSGKPYGKASFATDVASGVAVALISQTGFRIPSLGIGPGEIALSICTLIGLFIAAKVRSRAGWSGWGNIGTNGVFYMAAYLLIGLLPLTLYYSSAGMPGSSVRDWVAYAFCAAFLCSLAFRPSDYRALSGAFVAALIALWVASLLFGSLDIWYYGRFRGWAQNPNQVALYVLCGIILVLSGARQCAFSIAVFPALFAFGYLSKSDALLAALLAFMAAGIFMAVAPFGTFRRRVPWMLLALVILYIPFRARWHGLLASMWAAADNDSARLHLYSHGIDAWLSSVPSFLFGFGAGSYSGLDTAFQGAEAHNTVIDALTVGGFPMLLAVYLFPMAGIFLSYRQGRVFEFGALSALIVFTLFHYVARQPAYWLACYGMLAFLVPLWWTGRAIRVPGSGSMGDEDFALEAPRGEMGRSGPPVA